MMMAADELLRACVTFHAVSSKPNYFFFRELLFLGEISTSCISIILARYDQL